MSFFQRPSKLQNGTERRWHEAGCIFDGRVTVPRKLTVSATVAGQFWIVLRAKPQNEYRHGYDHCISSLEMYFRHVLPVNRTVSEFVPNSCRRVSRVTIAGDRTDFPKSKMASTNVSPPLCVRVHYELHFDDYVRDNSWSWFTMN